MLLSRIGGSRGGFGQIDGWHRAEEAALACADRVPLTILRCGPLLGGPYTKGFNNLAQRDESIFVDKYFRSAKMQVGDGRGVAQPGFGTTRSAAAHSIAGALRRAPPALGVADYTFVSLPLTATQRPVETAEAWDELFEIAAAPSSLLSPAKETTAKPRAFYVALADERLAALTTAGGRT